MTQKQGVLTLNRVGKRYTVYPSARARLASLFGRDRAGDDLWVLRDVSFTLQRGQCMGVVGNNGAGKSSLLKLVAGTLSPTTGSVQRDGRVTAILELGAGFHPDFSGRENLMFGAQLIGLSAQDVAQLADDIIDFAELREAIDRPVKSYSSGMVVRLAFAMVTAVEPAVLIVDEALAVGDQNFQKKCIERIEGFRRNGCTILFCSHSLYHVRHLCDVALWLDVGRVQACGETEAVLAQYEAFNRQQQVGRNMLLNDPHVHSLVAAPPDPDLGRVNHHIPIDPTRPARLMSVEVDHLSADGLLLTDALVVRVLAESAHPPSVGVMLEQAHGTGITSVATHVDGFQPRQRPDGAWEATVTFPNLPLHSGDYVVSAYLFDSQGLVVCDEWLKHRTFRWVSPSPIPGLVRLPHTWTSAHEST